MEFFSQTPMFSGEICKLTEAPYLFSRIRICTDIGPLKSETSGGLWSPARYTPLNPPQPSVGIPTSEGWTASTTSAGIEPTPSDNAPATLW